MSTLMTRRESLAAIAVCAVATLLGDTYQPVGLMDIDRWYSEGWNERGYTTLLDGVDISHDCVWFNDLTGEAYCYKRDSERYFYADDDYIAGHILRGQVRMVKL